jgi:hypothetical protein
VPDSTDVNVGLISFKLSACHVSLFLYSSVNFNWIVAR